MSTPFAVGGLLLAGLLIGPSGAAQAADELGLSKDGSTWSATLSEPLFDPDFRWVPGDEELSSFYIRNQGPSGANLTISVRSTDTDQLLSGDDIALSVRASGGPWIDLENGVATTALSSGAIGRSGTVRVDVRVTFDPSSANATQAAALPLAFVVTLTEASTSIPDDDTDDSDDSDDADDSDDSDDGSSGELPSSGATLRPQTLWLAAVLIGGGFALVCRTRRQERTDV